MLEVLWEVFLETCKALPILYLVYLLVGYLSHKNKAKQIVKYSRRLGPLIGSTFGVVPQCGFAAVMADLFARRSITIGTLFAVFIATSDEALAILILYPEHYGTLLVLIGLKLVLAVVIGYLIDLIFFKQKKNLLPCTKHEICDCSANHVHRGEHEHQHCEHKDHNHSEENKLNHGEDLCTECHCCATNIFFDALMHTLKIAALLFCVGLVIGWLMFFIGEDALKSIFGSNEILSILLASLIGLIPTCAISAVLVGVFVSGVISFPTLLAGLCAGAGLGLVVLFAKNRNLKQNLLIVLALYIISVVIGLASYFIMSLF